MSTFNIGNVGGTGNVFGDHNSVIGTAGPIAELERSLAEHRGLLHDPSAATEALRLLRAEFEMAPPRRHRVSELLGVITTSAGGATAVAQAVEGVRAMLS